MTVTGLAHEATGSGLPETVVLVVGGVGVCALYLAGTRRLVGPGSAAAPPTWAWRSWAWRRYAFCAGVAVVVLALLPVIDPVVDASFPLHMVQHMLLVLVAAPLLALGGPGLPLLLALPRGWRRRVAFVRSARPVRRARALATAPVLGIAGYGVLVVGWHLPAIYDAALESDPIHITEHACFLVGGWLLWLPIATPRQVLDGGRAVIYVFLSGFPMSLVGVILTFAPRPLYPAQTGKGPGAVSAQQLAGVLMWVPSGIATLGICGVLLLTWLRRMDRDAPDESALPPPIPPALPDFDPTPVLTTTVLSTTGFTRTNREVPR